MWVGGQRQAPAALPPGKTQYPLYSSLGGSQGRSGLAKNLVPTGIRSRTVQSLYRLSYPAHYILQLFIQNFYTKRPLECYASPLVVL